MGSEYKFLALLAVVVAICIFTYQAGYKAGFDARDQICIADAKKKAEANEKVISKAGNDLETRLKNQMIKNDELQKQLEELERAAAADPLAGQCGLSADSVRRVNSVR